MPMEESLGCFMVPSLILFVLFVCMLGMSVCVGGGGGGIKKLLEKVK